MEWRHESEYVKTSDAQFEQLRGYAQGARTRATFHFNGMNGVTV